jgi:hypothetical protein
MVVIGDLTHILSRVGKVSEVQRKTVLNGGFTGDTVTWNKLSDVVIALHTLTGSEVEKTNKLGIEASYKAYTKYKDLIVSDRIKYNNIYFYITFIDNPLSLGDFYILYLKRDDSYGINSNK